MGRLVRGALLIGLLSGCTHEVSEGQTVPIENAADSESGGGDVLPPSDTDSGQADVRGGDVAPSEVPIRGEDTGPGPLACDCQDGQVWLVGACVPTPLLGCGQPCSMDDPASCAPELLCDPTAATPLCTTSSSTPACVPGMSMSFEDGALRLYPSEVAVGQEVTLSVSGGSFYIGAAYWMMRIGDKVLEPLTDAEAACTISTPWTPTKAGVVPVHVAYGFGGVPNVGWALVGFLSVDAPSSDIQPGFSCSAEASCAQAPPYTCTCQEGYCACTGGE